MSTLVSASAAGEVTPDACSKRVSPTLVGAVYGLAGWDRSPVGPRVSRHIYWACGWLATSHCSQPRPSGGVPLPVAALGC